MYHRNPVTRTLLLGGLVLALAAIGLPALAQDAPELNSGEQQLQALLDEAGLFYQRQQLNSGRVQFRVAIEAGGKTSMIFARVHTWKWKRPGDKPLYSVYLYSKVLPGKEGGLSAAIVRAAAKRNDIILTGNYSATDEGVYANSGFYLDGVDSDLLESYFYALHFNRVGLLEDLQPILDAEASEG